MKDNESEITTKECTFCGLDLELSENFCSRCGVPAAPVAENPDDDDDLLNFVDTDPNESCEVCSSEVEDGKCQTCGHADIQAEDDTDNFHLEALKEANLFVSMATLANAGDKEIRDLANHIVWGTQE